MAHSWEERDVWEEQSPPESDAEFDYESVTPEEAGEELASMLIGLKHSGVLSAKQVCLLSFWASKAGACGQVAELKFRPDDPSTGHYSRHFDLAAGTRLDDDMFYEVLMPSHRRCDACNDRYGKPSSTFLFGQEDRW